MSVTKERVKSAERWQRRDQAMVRVVASIEEIGYSKVGCNSAVGSADAGSSSTARSCFSWSPSASLALCRFIPKVCSSCG